MKDGLYVTFIASIYVIFEKINGVEPLVPVELF